MKRQIKHTFNDILNQTAETNMKRLMAKARVANCIAKTVQPGPSRRTAYRIKVKALLGLRNGFPEKVKVKAHNLHRRGLVLVFVSSSWSLHAPSESFQGTN